MKKKPLFILFCLGIIYLVTGLLFLYKNARFPGVAFTSLGVMWMVMCIGQAKKMKKNSPM